MDRARKFARCRPSLRAHDEGSDDAEALPRVVARTGAREGSPVAMTLFKAEFLSLADNVQQTFRMRYQEGMSCMHIAEVLCVSVSCVKTRLHRARRRLQEALCPSR